MTVMCRKQTGTLEHWAESFRVMEIQQTTYSIGGGAHVHARY